MKTRFNFLFIYIFCAARLGAQDYVISLKHWGIKEGLPHRQVNCICQDSRGLIWVGTPYGLSRFDGYGFTTYLASGPDMRYNDVSSIAEDALGNLWLSCRGIGNNFNKYIVFDPVTDNEISVEELTKKKPAKPFGRVAALSDHSILIWEVQNDTFYTWHPSKGWDTMAIPPAFQVIGVLTKEQIILAINDRQELAKFDIHGHILKTRTTTFAKDAFFFELEPVIDNRYLLDTITKHTYSISPDLEISDVTTHLPEISIEGFDDIFSAGPDGIMWRQGKLFHPTKKVLRDFVKDGSVEFGNKNRDIIADNKGRIWFCNDFGLYQLTVSKNKFRQYFKDISNISNYNSCRGIVATGDSLYVNSQMKGLFLVNRTTGKTVSSYNTAPVYNPSFALAKTWRGGIAGYIKWNILVLNGAQQRLFSLPGAHRNHCWTMYEVDTGRFLLGREFGLTWFDLDHGTFSPFTQYNQYNELANYNIIYICRDKMNKLWFCGNNGFYEYDRVRGVIARYSSADTGIRYLPANDFHHFFQDDSGIYWLSTTRGLIRWDRRNNTSVLYSRSNGLSNNNINAAYDDNSGNIWLSSDYGIMRFNKSTGNVKTYLTEDGLTYNEFNRSSHFKDDSGNIYFGSLNGVTAFKPVDFTDDPAEKTSSSLLVTSFQQFNGETNKLENRKAALLKTNTITLKPQDRFFVLEFALINYSEPELTTYYWKIDGIDSEWNIQKDRTLRLSRLPYGSRILHIKAQESNGNWSANELSIKLNILRPIYLQFWFIVSVVALLLSLTIIVYRWRIYLLKKENERLDTIVNEKTKDLQVSLQQKRILLEEVHHRVKNNLQMISSLLELQSFKITGDDAKEAFLESQSRVMSIAIIHEKLYQNESFNTLDFRNFIDSLFSEIRNISQSPNQEVSLLNEFPQMYFNIDIAIPLGLILNELITNSLKHAATKSGNLSIHISFRKEDKYHVLVYRDNGKGLPPAYDWQNGQSLGMQLIHMQSLQLGGYTLYHFDNGCVFSVSSSTIDYFFAEK